MPKSVEWEMSPKQLAAFTKRVERYQGKPLVTRYQKGSLAAAQYLARPIRAGAPRRSGRLQKSVKARQLRIRTGWNTRYGAITALAGPTAPHRHLVIRGHRIVGPKPNKVDTGRRSHPNPFVDEAVKAHTAEAMRIVSRALFGK